MSKVQMSHASARVIEHLAQVGPRSLQDLVQKFPSSSQTKMSQRLRNLEQGWWLQRVSGAGNQLVYRVHPEAYAKLPSIGLQIPPPPSMATCPKCGCKSYFDCTPQIAWCWASGLIEIGDAMPPDSPNGGGAIPIAKGPKYALKGRMEVVARHGIGASEGKLLVPGVPEADGMHAKGDALSKFLAWCNKSKPRDGVIFEKEFL